MKTTSSHDTEVTLDALEAEQLVRIVAKKFGIRLNSSALRKVRNQANNPKISSVVKHIESLEKSWTYRSSEKNRDYGQKVKGEVIKFWSIPKTSANFLKYFTAATKSKKVLEIGTSAGYSTIFLATGALGSGGNVFTIEKLQPKVDLAKRHFKDSGLKNITLLVGDASKMLQKHLGKIDLVFLDADKENYGKYLELILPKMKKGGFIIADNIFDYGHLMRNYLTKVLGTKLPGSQSDKRVRSYLLPIDNGLLITQKIKD